MQLLNRTAIVVRAKSRYVEWANSVREDGPKFTIEEARTNPGVYLVHAVVEDDEEPSDKELLDARATELFEAELARWTDDEEKWPDTRTPHAFRAWFDAEVIEAVADLDEDEPLGAMTEDEAIDAALSHCAWCGGHLEDNEVRLVPYQPGEDVEPGTRALPVTLDEDEQHYAIAVRADEFELAGDEDEDEEDEDDEAPAPRRRRDQDEEDEEEDEDEDDYDEDEEEEEEGFVLACCSEKCRAELEEALGEREGAEQ